MLYHPTTTLTSWTSPTSHAKLCPVVAATVVSAIYGKLSPVIATAHC
jgi:hypothetical protein